MLRCFNAKIPEVSCLSVNSRLNSKNQVGTGLVSALNEEKKVGLMFVQGKHQQKLYATLIYRLETNKKVIPDVFCDK